MEEGSVRMLVLQSRFDPSRLKERWDERTLPARFAGNDSVLDDVFIAKRNDDRVILIRKASGTWDPFSTVFRGRIQSAECGSVLRGYFSKRLFDYIVLVLAFLLEIYFSWRGYTMGAWSFSSTVVCCLFTLGLGLLAVPFPSARRRYIVFLKEITDEGL